MADLNKRRIRTATAGGGELPVDMISIASEHILKDASVPGPVLNAADTVYTVVNPDGGLPATDDTQPKVAGVRVLIKGGAADSIVRFIAVKAAPANVAAAKAAGAAGIPLAVPAGVYEIENFWVPPGYTLIVYCESGGVSALEITWLLGV